MIPDWLRTLKAKAARRARTERRARRQARPHVEQLEGREMPAASLVSANAGNADSGNKASQLNRPSLDAHAVSSDGTLVVFGSQASNLVNGVTDSNGVSDVYLRNTSTNTTTLVSRSKSAANTAANDASGSAIISADGKWVVFSSRATDLNVTSGFVKNDAANDTDLFLYEVATGNIPLLSHLNTDAAKTASVGNAVATDISNDGSEVVFQSAAVDLVTGQVDSPGTTDVFVFDRTATNHAQNISLAS